MWFFFVILMSGDVGLDDLSIFDYSSSFFFVNWTSLNFFNILYSTNKLCLLLLYLDYLVTSPVSSTVFPKGSVTGYNSSIGGGWMIFNFRLFKSIFLLIEFHYAFSISYIVLTCSVYHYCILLGFNTFFSCFFSGFLLFSPKWSVTGCDSSLGSSY